MDIKIRNAYRKADSKGNDIPWTCPSCQHPASLSPPPPLRKRSRIAQLPTLTQLPPPLFDDIAASPPPMFPDILPPPTMFADIPVICEPPPPVTPIYPPRRRKRKPASQVPPPSAFVTPIRAETGGKFWIRASYMPYPNRNRLPEAFVYMW